MIATLSGQVSEKLAGQVIVEVGGVGYGVQTTIAELSQLMVGDQVKLYIYEHIREQNHDLYGFSSKDSLELFNQLLEVSGVGPKMALSLLSLGKPDSLKEAINSGDVSFVSRASGVGQRLAQRLIVELKGKVGFGGSEHDSAQWLKGGVDVSQDDAVQALVALGYSASVAASALKEIDPKLPTEERLKLALSKI